MLIKDRDTTWQLQSDSNDRPTVTKSRKVTKQELLQMALVNHRAL